MGRVWPGIGPRPRPFGREPPPVHRESADPTTQCEPVVDRHPVSETVVRGDTGDGDRRSVTEVVRDPVKGERWRPTSLSGLGRGVPTRPVPPSERVKPREALPSKCGHLVGDDTRVGV